MIKTELLSSKTCYLLSIPGLHGPIIAEFTAGIGKYSRNPDWNG